MTVETTQVPGDENCFLVGNQRFRKQKRKKDQEWGEREKETSVNLINRKGVDGKVITCFECKFKSQYL